MERGLRPCAPPGCPAPRSRQLVAGYTPRRQGYILILVYTAANVRPLCAYWYAGGKRGRGAPECCTPRGVMAHARAGGPCTEHAWQAAGAWVCRTPEARWWGSAGRWRRGQQGAQGVMGLPLVPAGSLGTLGRATWQMAYLLDTPVVGALNGRPCAMSVPTGPQAVCAGRRSWKWVRCGCGRLERAGKGNQALG